MKKIFSAALLAAGLVFVAGGVSRAGMAQTAAAQWMPPHPAPAGTKTGVVESFPDRLLPPIRPALDEELRAMANADEIATSV